MKDEVAALLALYRSQLISELRAAEGQRNFYQRRIDEITGTLERMDRKDPTP